MFIQRRNYETVIGGLFRVVLAFMFVNLFPSQLASAQNLLCYGPLRSSEWYPHVHPTSSKRHIPASQVRLSINCFPQKQKLDVHLFRIFYQKVAAGNSLLSVEADDVNLPSANADTLANQSYQIG